jgi:3-oxoacyl-[acyl-carrier protein] reductase
MGAQRTVITGGSSGIGRAIGVSLAERDGARVVLLGRDESKLRAACDEAGQSASWWQCDVADAEQVREVVDAAGTELGGIDLLVTAAGYGTYFTTTTPFDEAMRAWDDQLGTNLRGAFLTIQAAAPHLRRPGGRIVTISSIGAFTGGSSPGGMAYAAAKAGLIGLTRGLARELSGEGITANAVAPGYIDTPFHKGRPKEAADAAVAQIPAARLGQPKDVAAAVRFLASDEASYMTGQVVHVNGGWWFGT